MWLEILRTISVPSRGDPTSGQLVFLAIPAELEAVGYFDCPKQAGFPSRGNAT
jgi:hypothetical protein